MHLVVITGLSGSGKSTAKHCLEDIGYFTIDNLPLPLLPEFLRLLQHTQEGVRKLAMVLDARGGDIIQRLPTTLSELKGRGYEVDLIYLEASDETLNRRFSETRRKHPLSPDESPTVGIRKERELLKSVREKSHWILDTSKLSVHELKAAILARYLDQPAAKQRLAIRITSFAFRNGVPNDADLVFDVRFLPNPFYKDSLRDLSGRDQKVSEFVLQSPVGAAFAEKLMDLIDFLLPHYVAEGKAYLHIALGCTGGKHRSVAVAEILGKHLRKSQRTAKIEHRDLKQ
jgi:UPF0042 nucleotide-binding protein